MEAVVPISFVCFSTFLGFLNFISLTKKVFSNCRLSYFVHFHELQYEQIALLNDIQIKSISRWPPGWAGAKISHFDHIQQTVCTQSRSPSIAVPFFPSFFFLNHITTWHLSCVSELRHWDIALIIDSSISPPCCFHCRTSPNILRLSLWNHSAIISPIGCIEMSQQCSDSFTVCVPAVHFSITSHVSILHGIEHSRQGSAYALNGFVDGM